MWTEMGQQDMCRPQCYLPLTLANHHHWHALSSWLQLSDHSHPVIQFDYSQPNLFISFPLALTSLNLFYLPSVCYLHTQSYSLFDFPDISHWDFIWSCSEIDKLYSGCRWQNTVTIISLYRLGYCWKWFREHHSNRIWSLW